MARKKDLGGLATLAGLAYMASRDKGGEGPAPSAPTADAGGDSMGMGSGPAPASDEDYGNEGRREGPMGVGKAPAAARPKPAAPKVSSTPDYGNEGRRPVKEASKPAYESPYDRSRREDREAGRDIGSVIESLKNKLTSEDTRKPLALKSTKSETGNSFMGAGMKKGGSVKGWGIARGSRAAKTY